MPAYDKLVRDKIPEIINESGKTCSYYIAEKDEYKSRLYEKLTEELGEFIATPSYEEAADIWEVFSSICRFHNLDIPSVIKAAEEKASSRGGFNDAIILKSVQDDVENNI